MTAGLDGTDLAGLWRHLVAAAHGGCPLPDRSAWMAGTSRLSAAEQPLLDLYADLLEPAADGMKVVAHLGQSLDGRIATETGHSRYVTCEANLVHMHRLRALSDAVLVGGATVQEDDPWLTVRHVEGPSPVRVVVDPARRLPLSHRVFRVTPPRTLLLCAREHARGHGHEPVPPGVEVVPIEARAGVLHPMAMLAALEARGLRRIFVEGGGLTVSRFLAARCIDRLQICIAPVIIGSGRPAFSLPPIATMAEALRCTPLVVSMGCDVLYACRLLRRPLVADPWQDEQIEMADGEAGAALRQQLEALLEPTVDEIDRAGLDLARG